MLLRKNVINDGVTKEALPTKVNITTTQMFNKSTCKYFTLLYINVKKQAFIQNNFSL